MSRRSSLPWDATSVPEIRRQLCNALDALVEKHSTALEPPADSLAGSKRLARLQKKQAEAIEEMAGESRTLRGAELYWVSRNMVDVAVDAADTLPEWTPAVAAPAPTGLLCWAKPADSVPYGPGMGHTLEVSWDAVWWFTRPDGVMQLQPCSRLTKNPEVLEAYGVSSPLWAADTVVLNARAPRQDEALGSSLARRCIAITGAAWLLMGQPNVAETRVLRSPTAERAPRGVGGPPREPLPVTLVDIRRPVTNRDEPQGKSDREYDRRWWVGGHWRQQPWGPGNSQRRPQWIAPYIKGPADAPLIAKEKVHVWRR